MSIDSPVSTTTPVTSSYEDIDLYRFIQIPASEKVPYPFWIGKYPVINAQYERFLTTPDYAEKSYWIGIQKFNENCIRFGNWGEEGWNWLGENTKDGKPVEPRYLDDGNLGISNLDNPVVGITWYEANVNCIWLALHWGQLAEGRACYAYHWKWNGFLLRVEKSP